MHERDHAAEASAALRAFMCSDALHCAQQFLDILLIGRAFAGVACRENFGRSAKRVNFETRIVCQDEQLSIL